MKFEVNENEIIKFELEPCMFCKNAIKCPLETMCDVYMKWNIYWIDMTSDANKEE